MSRLDPARLADIILAAPGWARVGITMPNQAMRERAADTIAATIVERIAEPALSVSSAVSAFPL